MKVLTVKQPWAHLIIHGGKDIENRTWKTKFRGNLLIHAAKNDDKEAMGRFVNEGLINPDELIRGAIIGMVRVVDCVEQSDSKWFQGPFGWVLKSPVQLTPIYCKGKLSLWEHNL